VIMLAFSLAPSEAGASFAYNGKRGTEIMLAQSLFPNVAFASFAYNGFLSSSLLEHRKPCLQRNDIT
jgi:hypothetical protein